MRDRQLKRMKNAHLLLRGKNMVRAASKNTE